MSDAVSGLIITVILCPGMMWLAVRGRSTVWRENFKLYDLKRFSILFGEFGIPRKDSLVAVPIIIYQVITYILYLILIALFIIAIVLDIPLMGFILKICSIVNILVGGIIFVVTTQLINRAREKKKSQIPKKDFMDTGNGL